MMVKQPPKSMSGVAREALTDADTYTLEFNGPSVSAQQKALLLSTLILTDYMFFEQDNGICACENGALRITLCEVYCCGSVCPCNIVIRADNLGGAPTRPDSEEMAR